MSKNQITVDVYDNSNTSTLLFAVFSFLSFFFFLCLHQMPGVSVRFPVLLRGGSLSLWFRPLSCHKLSLQSCVGWLNALSALRRSDPCAIRPKGLRPPPFFRLSPSHPTIFRKCCAVCCRLSAFFFLKFSI